MADLHREKETFPSFATRKPPWLIRKQKLLGWTSVCHQADMWKLLWGSCSNMFCNEVSQLFYNMEMLPKCGWLHAGYSLEYSIMIYWLSIWQRATAELNGNPQTYLTTKIFTALLCDCPRLERKHQMSSSNQLWNLLQTSVIFATVRSCSYFHWRFDAHGIKSLLIIPIINWCCAKCNLSSGILSSRLSQRGSTKTQNLNQPGHIEFSSNFNTDLKGGLGQLIEFSLLHQYNGYDGAILISVNIQPK